MEKSTRRNLLKRAAVAGGAAAGLRLAGIPDAAAALSSSAGRAPQDAHSAHHRPPDGPLATTTVSFGAWPADPTAPLDRFRSVSPNNRNVHLLIPHEATIQAGGSVNFVISGFHLVVIYDDGHQPGDVNATLVPPTGPPFIDDPNRRIYRGLDPSVLTYPQPTPPLQPPDITGVRERVETVQFPHPGRYLVICGFRPHFLDDMYGFVRVLP